MEISDEMAFAIAKLSPMCFACNTMKSVFDSVDVDIVLHVDDQLAPLELINIGMDLKECRPSLHFKIPAEIGPDMLEKIKTSGFAIALSEFKQGFITD